MKYEINTRIRGGIDKLDVDVSDLIILNPL